MKAKSGVRVLCKLGCNYLSNIRSLPPSHKSTLSIPNINEGLAREKDNRSMQATTRASNFCKHNFWACSYACGHTSLLCLPPSHRLPDFLSCEFQGRDKRPDRSFNSSHFCWNRPWSCRGGTFKKAAPSCVEKPYPQLGELQPLSWACHHCSRLLRRKTSLEQHSASRIEVTALCVAALTLLPCTHHTQYHTSVALNNQRHWPAWETGTLEVPRRTEPHPSTVTLACTGETGELFWAVTILACPWAPLLLRSLVLWLSTQD